ncbi:MAG: hypothetical protein IK066_11485 [Kiritimatiellae bacterium]|nr:hypothetical protein [Kiritimatiellia bacterium]
MKSGWKTCLCALAVSGLASAARADLVVPPNDYTRFLAREKHSRDTPELREEYDRMCIEWYNAHCGDGTGEYDRYWRKEAPLMRQGAPEAVTNAYEAFRNSFRSGRDMRDDGSPVSRPAPVAPSPLLPWAGP